MPTRYHCTTPEALLLIFWQVFFCFCVGCLVLSPVLLLVLLRQGLSFDLDWGGVWVVSSWVGAGVGSMQPGFHSLSHCPYGNFGHLICLLTRFPQAASTAFTTVVSRSTKSLWIKKKSCSTLEDDFVGFTTCGSVLLSQRLQGPGTLFLY